MKLRSLGLALISFFLGAGAFWLAFTHTGLRHYLQKPTEYRAVDTNDMNWVDGAKGGPAKFSMKFLYKDVNSRQVAMLVRYPAGQMQPPHVHTYGHGIYVLSGKLVTHRGTYGPGTFVWFPANEVVSHGASPDEDVVFLFLRDEDMDIQYAHSGSH